MRRSLVFPLCTLATSLTLAACSDAPAPPPARPPAPQVAASSHVSSPLDPLLKARAKAKNVQNIVNAQAKRQQKAIEQQSR
ncbi:MAG TPA: hypothetical protein VFJ15_12945 [Oleiagrimonas sp.]|nr:hypothetical protein [Oleiagrimonas sp.]